MIAIAIREPGGPEVLIPAERPVPSIGPNDVLIKVAAAGVNRPDIMQRQGRYTPPPGVTDMRHRGRNPMRCRSVMRPVGSRCQIFPGRAAGLLAT